MKTEITPKDIFQKNQILTLEVAKKLIGKQIATTSSEYSGNHVDVRIGTILSIESEWDLAGKQDDKHLDGGKYATRQDYWNSYMTESQIKNAKNRLKIVSEEGSSLYGTCEMGVFFGSDSDREIYYVEIPTENFELILQIEKAKVSCLTEAQKNIEDNKLRDAMDDLFAAQLFIEAAIKKISHFSEKQNTHAHIKKITGSNHTLGNWEWSKQNTSLGKVFGAQVFGPDGKSLACIEFSENEKVATDNAKIMAAAPDLLDAILNIKNSVKTAHLHPKIWNKINYAIKKAIR